MVQEGLTRLQPLRLLDGALKPVSKTAFAKVATLESSFYLRNQLLRDSDWAGMAHSLEIRTPLVDYELLRRTAPILVKKTRPQGKTLLAAAPQVSLPKEVLSRRKSGFGIPVERWFSSVADKTERMLKIQHGAGLGHRKFLRSRLRMSRHLRPQHNRAVKILKLSFTC